MLSLNSYGLPRCSNNSSNHGASVTLPRLNVGSPHARMAALSPFSPAPPRGARSLSKLEMMRRAEHPLYRTTTGYEYGKHLEIPDSALSVPKHARQAEFTHEFVAGPFADTSLTSIDKSKLRAESWQHKVEERTKQMKIKYDEMQEKLEVKKRDRRRERDARRREMERRDRAAVVVQARARGFLVRRALQHATLVRHTAAAGKIQQVFRSREQVKRAKEELEAKRRQWLDGFATKLQHACKRYLLKREAMRQLKARRRDRVAATRKGSERDARGRFHVESELTQDEAAFTIQRAMRQRIGRRIQRSLSIRSATSTASSVDGNKDAQGDGGGGGGASASASGGGVHSARSKQTQRLARRTIVSLKQRKREKSVQRLL